MTTLDPASVTPGEFYRHMIGTIGPRPIAFVSSVDALGRVNLSPFSFFTIAGYNPPTLLVIPTINRHGQKKHTLLNVEQIGEVVISVVSHAMVEQMSLTSAEFDRGVDEFGKAGFTPLASTRVRPPRVAESPASYECIVKQIIPMREAMASETNAPGMPGMGHVVVCEVVMGHFQDAIFGPGGSIDQASVDLIGRLGGDWYSRTNADALFAVARPAVGIGADQIPFSIRNSAILSGNDLGKLASYPELPPVEAIRAYQSSGILSSLLNEARNGCQYLPDLLHLRAKQLLAENNVKDAWLTLLTRLE